MSAMRGHPLMFALDSLLSLYVARNRSKFSCGTEWHGPSGRGFRVRSHAAASLCEISEKLKILLLAHLQDSDKDAIVYLRKVSVP